MKRLLLAALLLPSLAHAADRSTPPPFNPTPLPAGQPAGPEAAPEPASNAQIVAMQWEAVAKQQDAYATAMKAMAVPLQNLLNEQMSARRALDAAQKLNQWYEGQLYGAPPEPAK